MAALNQHGRVREVSKLTDFPLSEKQRPSKKARSELLYLMKEKAVVVELSS